MNKRTLIYILGWVMFIEGLAMQLSTLVGLFYGEKNFRYFLYIGLALIVVGLIVVINKPKRFNMSRRDGFAATALSWIMLSVFGALPLSLSGQIPHYIDALFESVSGFTTTGSTILENIEALEFRAREENMAIGVPLAMLGLKDELQIVCINRGGEIIIPTGKDCIELNDSDVIVTKHKGLFDLKDILK